MFEREITVAELRNVMQDCYFVLHEMNAPEGEDSTVACDLIGNICEPLYDEDGEKLEEGYGDRIVAQAFVDDEETFETFIHVWMK